LRSFKPTITGTHGLLHSFKDDARLRWRVGGINLEQEKLMQKCIMPIIAVAMLGGATSAMAYDSGGLISMQAALGVATDLGLATVSHTQFAGDEWQIEGRDLSGRYMEVDVDAATGEVLNVDR
jgi:hypothetical protein